MHISRSSLQQDLIFFQSRSLSSPTKTHARTWTGTFCNDPCRRRVASRQVGWERRLPAAAAAATARLRPDAGRAPLARIQQPISFSKHVTRASRRVLDACMGEGCCGQGLQISSAKSMHAGGNAPYRSCQLSEGSRATPRPNTSTHIEHVPVESSSPPPF